MFVQITWITKPTSRSSSHEQHLDRHSCFRMRLLTSKRNLRHYKPPKVPSGGWDVEYDQLVDVGRDNWKGRTKEMNETAAFIFGSQQKGSLCRSPVDFWFAIARETLPKEISLYETVVLFSKLGVPIHESRVVLAALQYGFWFWRPVTAFRARDKDHKPIPDWKGRVLWNTLPEFPSDAATISGSAGAVMEAFFCKTDMEYTIQGMCPGPACSNSSDVIGPRHYKSIAAAVEDTKLGRMYAGAHYNVSVRHGAKIGAKVAHYIWKDWDRSPEFGLPERRLHWSPLTFGY